eukprot:TRINITY_DN10249_c0_g1_i2.p1 TRINITY_DN10249_c0_g1~~TRINITY_DN10249_c0_g1_i2.p1  ORF type:complete len:118 (-),score=21.73 TRINITY_DN10249_c0_g1_i2:102-455(-)
MSLIAMRPQAYPASPHFAAVRTSSIRSGGSFTPPASVLPPVSGLALPIPPRIPSTPVGVQGFEPLRPAMQLATPNASSSSSALAPTVPQREQRWESPGPFSWPALEDVTCCSELQIS